MGWAVVFSSVSTWMISAAAGASDVPVSAGSAAEIAVGGGVGLAVEGNDGSCCSTFVPFSDWIGGVPS